MRLLLLLPSFHLTHLGIIPEMRACRITNNALGKVPPHGVGKVQFIRIEYGILVQ